VPGKREPTRPIGLGLSGSWVRLEPQSLTNTAEFDQFDSRREMNPAMGAGGRSSSSAIAAPMLIRNQSNGKAVGVVENHPLPGKVAVFVVYFDKELGRPGFGWEAVVLYISHLFDSGARLVTAEVLEFNAEMVGILRKVRLVPQARLREHVYSAGRFWDLLVYSFDRAEWVQIIDRYRRILPGGDRRPAGIGATLRR
jgi:RimJ/RimL family protein N-acetyltransferase